MTNELEPLITNGDLEKLARGILRLTKERQFAVHERLVYVRGTYERERMELHARIALLEDALNDRGRLVEFWRNMALGLKDELIERGDRIEELESEGQT